MTLKHKPSFKFKNFENELEHYFEKLKEEVNNKYKSTYIINTLLKILRITEEDIIKIYKRHKRTIKYDTKK